MTAAAKAAVLAVCSLILLGASAGRLAAGPAAGLTWTAIPKPFALQFANAGKPLTGQILDGAGLAGGRIGYVLTDGSNHTLTDLVSTSPVRNGTRYVVGTDETGRRATLTVTRRPNGRGLDVRYSLVPSTGVASVSESFTTTSGEQFLGGGESGSFVSLRGHLTLQRVSYSCGSEFPMPYYVSTKGYGIFVRNAHVGRMSFPGTEGIPSCSNTTSQCRVTPTPGRVALCFMDVRLRYEVYAGTPAEVQRAFTADAGRAPLAQPEQFGGQKWRGVWDDNTAAILLADAARYRRLRIPLTWMHINDPWEVKNCWGTLTFDERRFPDPAGLVAALRAQGLHTMLWVSPLVRVTPSCPAPAFAHLLGSGTTRMIDLTAPSDYATFVRRLETAFSIGIEGVKGDRGDEYDLESVPLANDTGSRAQNRYPVLFAKAVTTALRLAAPHGFSTIFRAGGIGSQALLPGVWVGDQPGTYQGMVTAIHAGLSASVSGIPVWGSDIGGYANATDELTPELFVRWAQFAALTPVFEVGGLGTSSHFWSFGKAFTDVFRDAAVLHYELVPTFLDLSREASRTGMPITRPLGFDYPSDPGSWETDVEFTVGPSLLVAPVVWAGASPTVYLPPGRWIDLFAGRTVPGRQTFVRPTPDQEFPLYLQAGSAIPFNLRSPDVWATPWGLSDLVRADRAGWLVGPGASGSATSTTAGRLRFTQRGSRLSIDVSGAPPDVELLVLATTPPRSVTIGGRGVGPSAASALKRVANGWTFRAQPFGGAVVKLRTVHGAARVELQL